MRQLLVAVLERRERDRLLLAERKDAEDREALVEEPVHTILERYLARTRGLAEQAIFNFENSPRTEFANRLQTDTPEQKAGENSGQTGAGIHQ